MASTGAKRGPIAKVHEPGKETMEMGRDVLKIACGVFLGMMAFWIVTVLLPNMLPPSAEERAAQDLLERQFAPAN